MIWYDPETFADREYQTARQQNLWKGSAAVDGIRTVCIMHEEFDVCLDAEVAERRVRGAAKSASVREYVFLFQKTWLTNFFERKCQSRYQKFRIGLYAVLHNENKTSLSDENSGFFFAKFRVFNSDREKKTGVNILFYFQIQT